jgi:Cu(I)/Ag(I) efflux system membrane protein CusA/SilA
MREFAYQKNQEFGRDLGKQLTLFAVEHATAMLGEGGLLRGEPTPGDLTALAEALPLSLAARLASDPALEDVTWLAQQTAGRMRQLGLVGAEDDLFRYRPNLFLRGAVALHEALGGEPPTFFSRLRDAVAARHRALWLGHVRQLDGELFDRATVTYTRLVIEELVGRATGTDPRVAAAVRERKRLRTQPVAPRGHHHAAGHHHPMESSAPQVDPCPPLDAVHEEAAQRVAGWVLLWRADRSELAGFGGELDRVMQMPGWTNVWTMPIQNRVDMLSTGVNTAVGVRILGRRQDDVVKASEEVAAVLKRVSGAADVVADPVRGKGYLEIHVDRDKAAAHGVSAGDVTDLVETALAGKVVTATVEGRERHPVRVRYARARRDSEEVVRSLLVPAAGGRAGGSRQVALSEVADIRVVDGPASIKSENGLLRNYVRLNVRGRDAAAFVDEARRVVAAAVTLPAGVYVEWTGQFEHQVRARRTLTLILPLVGALIFLILYLTYHDLADAVLMMLAVPGALAGGVFVQWLFGYPFSVTVWVGYIACFGMATATGIIMLVYLREAVEKAGGLGHLSVDGLRRAVMDGAVHRLRPKLLTEGTVVIGLAPMLWATGTGAEVIRPMVAPVLGGILVADEVIDLLLPVAFYWVRRRRLLRRKPSVPGV